MSAHCLGIAQHRLPLPQLIPTSNSWGPLTGAICVTLVPSSPQASRRSWSMVDQWPIYPALQVMAATIFTGSGGTFPRFVFGCRYGSPMINFTLFGVVRPDGKVDEERMATRLATPQQKIKSITMGPSADPNAPQKPLAMKPKQKDEKKPVVCSHPDNMERSGIHGSRDESKCQKSIGAENEEGEQSSTPMPKQKTHRLALIIQAWQAAELLLHGSWLQSSSTHD